ncbi:MAG: Panacea domain-containing protein [Myxococcota bacterium]|nr:Panacea domain-containing protein [Myxococcota bacterium]
MNQLRLAKALEHLVTAHGPIEGRTRLLKLVYLADKQWFDETGQVYTEAKYYRWNHGPFAKEVLSALEWLDGLEVVQRRVPYFDGTRYEYVRGVGSRLEAVELDPAFVAILDGVASTWGPRPLSELLEHVYADDAFTRLSFSAPLLGAAA